MNQRRRYSASRSSSHSNIKVLCQKYGFKSTVLEMRFYKYGFRSEVLQIQFKDTFLKKAF